MAGRPSFRADYLRRMGRSRRFREREGKFLVEGIRFVEEALTSNWPVETVLYCSRILESPRGKILLENAAAGGIHPVRVAESFFKEMADTETPQGIVAVVRKRAYGLDGIWETDRPVLLVLVDGVQDPGNLGAIVRSADAAGAGGVILLKGTADIYNPKALRATMGSIFHVPVFPNHDPEEVMSCLSGYGIKTVAGDPRAEKLLYECNFTVSCALVVGSEAAGPGKPVLERVSERVRIPMPGRAESLNAANSAAVLMYEVVRQRSMIRP